MDKERINQEIEDTPIQAQNSPVPEPAYVPKKNIVLKSGVRWIEKGIVYDPSMKAKRKLRKPEYDELLRKGLTKKDFDGFVFQ